MRELTSVDLRTVSGGAKPEQLRGIAWAVQQVPMNSTAYRVLSSKIGPTPTPVPATPV
jgi:hypothetical protein